MRRATLLSGALAALLTIFTMLVGSAAGSTPQVHYFGGPIMSSERWVEVVWGSGLSSENATLPAEVASYLTDDAADSGKTTNAFAVLAQYSTVGMTGGSNQVAAYDQSFAGSTQIAPSECATATTCSLQESHVEEELESQIAAGNLPAPTGDGLSTAYLVLFPQSVTITDNFQGVSDQQWCSEYGATKLSNSSTHVLFAMVPDLGEPGNGCGSLSTHNENVVVQVSHQQHELITDPLIGESAGSGEEPPTAWYAKNEGSVADICNQKTGLNTINGHQWEVEKIWSNAENACVATTNMFSPPSAGFTATPNENTASFAASGTSTNHLSTVPAGIASYSWDFGDGQVGSGATPTHAYAAAGTYSVTVTATDALGFTAQASHQVTVSAPPAPPAGGSGNAGGTTGNGNSNAGGGSSNAGGGSNGSTGTGGGSGAAKASVSNAGGVSSTASAGGAILVNIGEIAQCPNEGGLCVVSVQVEIETAHPAKKSKSKNRKLTVGGASLTVSPGAAAKLSFKLNATGKRLLAAHGHLLAKLTVTIHHGTDAPLISTHVIRIAAPKKQPSHKR